MFMVAPPFIFELIEATIAGAFQVQLWATPTWGQKLDGGFVSTYLANFQLVNLRASRLAHNFGWPMISSALQNESTCTIW
jgi:hypothetical protein